MTRKFPYPSFSALILIAALTFGACAGPRPATSTRPPLPPGFPGHSAGQIEGFVLSSGQAVEAVSARASLSVDSPEQSGRFSAQLQARRQDSLLITVSPGLGIEAVRALVTPDSLFIYDRIRSELSYGAVGAAGNTLGVPLGEEDLFGNLLGIFFPDAIGWSVSATDSAYVLTDESGLRSLTVDPALWRILRYEQRTASGSLVEERVYSEYEPFEGVYLPRRVIFRRPGEETTASLYYRELVVNPPDLNFDLRVSSSATRTPLPSAR